MGTIELRKEKRISVNDLPEKYSNFSVLLPHGVESTVNTTDASLNGFGFTSNLPKEDFVVGFKLVLYPLGTDLPVYGTIVHVSKTEMGTRVGVRLLPIGGYKLYNSEIQNLLEKL